MRVLHVTGSYYPAVVYGGPIFSIHNLCRFLVREGVEVSVLTTNANGSSVLGYPTSTPVDQDGVQVRYCARSLPIRHVISLPLRRAIKRDSASFDLIHAHSSFCLHTLWAAEAARKAGIPYVVSPHGSLNREYIDAKSTWKKNIWFRLFEQQILEGADTINFTSEHEKTTALELGLNLRKSEVIPIGINPEEWKIRSEDMSVSDVEKSQLNRPFILFFGRISWEKGIRQLISGFFQVKDEFPDVTLLLAGPDNEGLKQEMEKQIRHLGITDRVRYLGFLDRALQKPLLEKCVFLALPSISENFGLAAAEAMYFSRPVLLTPGVGIADEVIRAGAGVVIEQDADCIAEGIRHLLANPERANRMGERGRQLVEEKFMWPTIAKRTAALYRDLLATRNRL